ncbi:uncharacterized protein LOC114242118 [Bombyx mandarina]|uniref:Uncharacterized protein LOC114242118 n=1 Tax=Bombyx mandarina TaxID=7092 RepID=A0A6J2JHE7_BOMMA|nr:uncharacterized protein LOC114242118 [Bombyx mandarina]
MHYDLIIVGSGSVGSSAGYYASRSGLKVLMLDEHTPPHSSGSHHGATRLVRCAYGEGTRYIPLLIRARELWKELNELTKTNIYEKCGVLNTGLGDSSFIDNARRSAEIYGLEIENMTAEDIKKRWNGIQVPGDYVGVFEPDAGFLRSELAVNAYVKLSKEAGAHQIFDCKVSSVTPTENEVVVETEKGTFKGRKALVSAGTWVKDLLPNLPISPVRKVLTWYAADPCYNNIPGFLVNLEQDFFYGFPADENGFKIAKHSGGQNISSRDELTPFGSREGDRTETLNFITSFLPNTGGILEGKTCSYDMSPDEDFIIDTLPGSENVMLVTGLSGHGFKFTSVLGEIAAFFAGDKKPGFDISPFALSRFNHM